MQPPSTESEPPFSMAAIVNDKVDMVNSQFQFFFFLNLPVNAPL